MPTKHTDQPIRILHLSDAHFRASKAWDADPVLRALAQFVKTEVEAGLAPDLVVISGDLAFSGIAEEYALAREWLDAQLWPALPADLPRDHLLLVPGNHDVDRKKVSAPVRLLQNGLLNARSQDDIAELLGDDDERHMMVRRHAAYLAFVAGWCGEPQRLPWWQRVIEIRGTRLYLAGLNSAWMSCGDEDRSRLLLGRYQLTQTVMTEQAKGAVWSIAVLHHPWEYVAEFDHQTSRAAVHQHCDLLLRGHLHQPLTERVLPPDPSRACLELAAGCVYENSEYPNAFQWIELSPADKRVRVLFRAWLHNSWTVDRNQPNCPHGHADFEFDAQQPVTTNLRAAAPKIPTEYLGWLRGRYTSVELLGQDTQQGQAVTLSQVYVPVLTQSAQAATAEEDAKQQLTRATEEKQPTLLLQRLDKDSLYVPAPAGAGKSTFCRWAALQSIPGAATSHPVPAPEGYEEPVPAALRTRLPLLVPLREFCRDMDCGRGRQTWNGSDLEQALAAWVDSSLLPGLNGMLLGKHLRTGSAFVLLDGLDEVPMSESRNGTTVYPRALLLSGLADALPRWEKAGNRTLLTSRPYGLDEAGLTRLGLQRAPLEPLPQPLQDLFVTRWFHTLGQRKLTEGLVQTIRDREDLAPLVEIPMLLTALCVIYGTGRRLPEDRYHLYQRIVDNVLYSRYRGDAREREPVKARLEAIALGMHTGESGAARQTPAPEVSQAETERLLRDFAELNPAYETGRIQPTVQCEELLTRSGLLLPRPEDRAAFYHLSFQEFLAAERIAHTSDDRQALKQIFRERGTVPEWRPTLVFLFAAQIFNYRNAQWGLDLLGCLIADQDRAAVEANPASTVLIAEALELCLAKGYRIPDILAEGFRRLSLDAIEDEIEVQTRQSLGLTLGRLDDRRIADLRDPSAYVEVPAGTYPYGEKGETVEIAAPFRIGRYPVTNSQYRAFLVDGGYSNREWWSDAGWAWLRKGATEPARWREWRWNGPNQPVVGVSFWEAEACCAWAGGRLPSEQEWEAAARGPEGCEYPWCGDWENGICNTQEAGLGITSPVGLFPRSRQAQLGLEDLVGNVWEWCSPFDDPDGTEESDAPRVLRGGSWGSNQDSARCAYRIKNRPSIRFYDIGFRLVCSSPILEP